MQRLPPRLRDWLAPAPDSGFADARRVGRSPWTDAIHLLWSAWIFITPMFGSGYDARWAALTLASYPLFLLLYAKVLLAPRRNAWRYAAAMVALSMVLLPVYPSGISYFVFGCVMLGVAATRGLAYYLVQLLVLNAIYLLLAWRIGYPWQMLAWLPAMTLIIGVIVRVEGDSQRKDMALKLSLDEVRRLAATAERERIGRDLHDLLGHTLSLITLKLELARKLAPRDAAASLREVEEAEGVARHALAEVRSAVTGIRAADLAAELASAHLLLASAQVHLEHDPPPEGLPVESEQALALVLREAVTNVARHARASRVHVGFEVGARWFALTVADDGCGGAKDGGNGIGGMRARMEALGGTLLVESPKRHGTVLRARLPMAVALPTGGAPAVAATSTKPGWSAGAAATVVGP